MPRGNLFKWESVCTYILFRLSSLKNGNLENRDDIEMLEMIEMVGDDSTAEILCKKYLRS